MRLEDGEAMIVVVLVDVDGDGDLRENPWMAGKQGTYPPEKKGFFFL
jgi:hypothetical protein